MLYLYTQRFIACISIDGQLVKRLTHRPLKATFMGSNPILVTSVELIGLIQKGYQAFFIFNIINNIILFKFCTCSLVD